VQNPERIEQTLRLAGPLSAREICERLDISQATFSRGWRASKRLLKIGAGRSSRYACLRNIRDQGSQWVLFQVQQTVIPHTLANTLGLGTLYAVWPEKMVFQPVRVADDVSKVAPSWMMEGVEDGVFPGIPWFLDELVPQGFLGRNFAENRAQDLGIGPDPGRWGFEERVRATLDYGADVPGAFLLGIGAVTDAYDVSDQNTVDDVALPDKELIQSYEQRSRAVLAGEAPGSSAGGEQQKFSAVRDLGDARYQRVLVKFSGPISTAVGRRWADLLEAESIALALLNRHGIPAAPCRILSGENRVFLESMRFDRIGVRGRRGMISLRPLLAAFDGGLDESWAAVAPRLATMGWISAEAAALMQRAHWFGVLIGNTDMHYGNVSVFLTEERPFELCPLYDMLPMRYRPSSTGDLPDGGLEAAGRPRLLPGPLDVKPWSEMSQLAREFWREVAACDSISAGFREIASLNEQYIQTLRTQIIKGEV